MRFIKNGPDIPDELLFAHEEGRVVFFCGAGISMPAGLPDFAQLTNKVLEVLRLKASPIEQQAMAINRFDIAIGLIEKRDSGMKAKVRQAIAKLLSGYSKDSKSFATHQALLGLAVSRGGSMRLVTTNFDRLFEEVFQADTPKYRYARRYSAPALPVPKLNWNGLVYLHGRLGESPRSDGSVDELVLTSGDFGLAYLKDQWAARFVTELFQNFTICFVGYSVEDPVMRYMMDAFAADQRSGATAIRPYAFGVQEEGAEHEQADAWRAKGVEPILYHPGQDHALLHCTIKAWEENYTSRKLGKDKYIEQYASRSPLEIGDEEIVRRILWAVSDTSGIFAKQFSDVTPIPPLEWLFEFAEPRFSKKDLQRFGVRGSFDCHSFSLLARPSSAEKACMMALVARERFMGSPLDRLMRHLGQWLAKHVEDPRLLAWVVREGGCVHPGFSHALSDSLKSESVSSHVRILWQMVLLGRMRQEDTLFRMHKWIELLEIGGCTPALRIEFRDMIAPVLTVDSISGVKSLQVVESFKEWSSLAFEVRTQDTHPFSAFSRILRKDAFRRNAQFFLDDVEQSLRDALEIRENLDKIGMLKKEHPRWVRSIIELRERSYDPLWQSWVYLLRETCIVVGRNEFSVLERAIMRWLHDEVAILRRLAISIATRFGTPVCEKICDEVITPNADALWCEEFWPEINAWMKCVVSKLSPDQMKRLWGTIIEGPPPTSSFLKLDDPDWNLSISKRMTLDRIETCIDAGGILPDDAANYLSELRREFPHWHMRSEEFIKSLGGPALQRVVPVHTEYPLDLEGIVATIEQSDGRIEPIDVGWYEYSKLDPEASLQVLQHLANKGRWGIDYWQESLRGWADADHTEARTESTIAALQALPGDVFAGINSDATRWVKTVTKSRVGNASELFALCHRLLEGALKEASLSSADPHNHAINMPGGWIVEAVLNLWYSATPQRGEGLSGDVHSIFSEICASLAPGSVYGRCILAGHVESLMFVDEQWTSTHILPLFQWNEPEVEARNAWVGYLYSPRGEDEFVIGVRGSLEDTARHYMSLGDSATNFSRLVAFLGLQEYPVLTDAELHGIMSSLPKEGVATVARALHLALLEDGQERDAFWTNHLGPFLKRLWPSSVESMSQFACASLAELAAETDLCFPLAVDAISEHLHFQPEVPEHLLEILLERGHCQNFPGAALELIDWSLHSGRTWGCSGLGECLETIYSAGPEVLNDPRFQRLSRVLGESGGSGAWGSVAPPEGIDI